MNKKRVVVTSVISIILVTILMFGSTYSIFTTSDIDDEANVYQTGILDITYTLSDDNVVLTHSIPTSIEESLKIEPYRIIVTNKGTVPYRFDVILNNTTASNQIDSRYIMTQVGKLEPKLLNDCSENIIKEDVVVLANSSVEVDVRVWLSDSIQNTEIEKSFFAKLEINGVAVYEDNTDVDNSLLIANRVKYLNDYIIDLYNDGSELEIVNLNDGSLFTKNTDQEIFVDNNNQYRYYGKNPNNYVLFNNELWRIIGVFDVIDSLDDVGFKRKVKLIREESIGNYSWDSNLKDINSGNGVNDFTQADLNVLLNDFYYNKKIDKCYTGGNNKVDSCDFSNVGFNKEAKTFVDDTLWYLGGIDYLENLSIDDYYSFERGLKVYNCDKDDGFCPRNTTWVGKIGLMYPSDFVYLTSTELCGDDESVSCNKENWLFNNTDIEWTMSPYLSSSEVFYIGLDGKVGYDLSSSFYGVRPVVYLNTDVAVFAGSGTKDNPYKLFKKNIS